MKKTVIVTIFSGLAFFSANTVLANPVGLVAKKASILSKMHKKAKKALVNAAQDKTFGDFFATSDKGQQAQLKSKIEQLTLNVQKRFHVEEMCLIGATGPELTRIVGNEIAPDSDLSPDESGAAFFKPSFAQKPRTTYISKLYMSPDADKWVLAYITPIVAGGEKKAILHYEHGLDVFQAALNKGIKGSDSFIIAVNKEGWVVSDSRNAIKVGKSGEKENSRDYFKKFDLDGNDHQRAIQAINAGQKVAGYSGAFKQVGNWTLFAFEK